MTRTEDLGPTSLDAPDVAHVARECLEGLGFRVLEHVTPDVVVLQGTRDSWGEALTGRRRALVVRLSERAGRWRAEARLTDFRENLAFFTVGALLGPAGLAAAAASALSRLFSEDERRELLAHLARTLGERSEEDR